MRKHHSVICPSGGIGRRTRLKIVRETMWVQIPPSAPKKCKSYRLAFLLPWWDSGQKPTRITMLFVEPGKRE